MKVKYKWTTVGIFALLILFSAFFGLFQENGAAGAPITTTEGLYQTAMGGVKARMPDNSVQILFESMFGTKLSTYRSYDTPEAAVAALHAGQVRSIWVADVTARYLLRQDAALYELPAKENEQDRLSFAFALRQEETELLERLNTALAALRSDGTLDELIAAYVEADGALYEADMQVKQSKQAGALCIGVTGAVPPLDFVDTARKPCGFSVALADEIGLLLQTDVKLLVLDNETAFTELMGGRVDLLFCYGTSPNASTERPNYLMSDGYYPMNHYSVLVSRADAEE